MARQCKTGIDYFPLNIDMDEEDERVYMMEATLGDRSFGVLIKLLMWIYRNGYYQYWTEKEQIFFSRKKNIELDYCKQVTDFCIQKGFFCKHLFDKYRVLTSRGIQKRFFEAVTRRKKVQFIKEFLLLDPESEINDNINLYYVDINRINARNNNNCEHDANINEENACNNGLNASKSTQTRVNESKREESRREESKRDESKREGIAAPPSASPSEVLSPPGKPPPDEYTNGLAGVRAAVGADPEEKPPGRSKDEQLQEIAAHLKVEDPEEYKKLVKKHPELEEVPW